MSMLSSQANELREMADMIGSEGVTGDDLPDIQRALREAANTIISLRNSLQELQGVGGESRYTALFGTPERAARTLIRTAVICDDINSYCDRCPLFEAPSCSSNFDDNDHDALIEWLRGDA